MINIKPKYLSWLLRSIPNFLWPLKWFIMKKSLRYVGKKFRFNPNSIFSDHRLIEIGDNVFFSYNITINTTVPVKIGNHIMFGPDVMIIGGDHNISEVGIVMKDIKTGGENLPIILEDDVWIGSRVLVLKGVKIGEGAVIGAGSIVTKDVLPYSISYGNPCKPEKCRFTKKNLEIHLNLIKSKYNLEQIVAEFNKKKISI